MIYLFAGASDRKVDSIFRSDALDARPAELRERQVTESKAQALDELSDFLRSDRQRRCEEDVISALTIDTTAARISQQPAFHCGLLETREDAVPRIEGGLALAVRDELDPEEQTPASYLADMRMLAQRVAQRRPELVPAGARGSRQIMVAKIALHR